MGNVIVCCSSLDPPDAPDAPEWQPVLEHVPALPRSASERTLSPR